MSDKKKAQYVYLKDTEGNTYTFTGVALPDKFRRKKGWYGIYLSGIGEPFDLPEDCFFEEIGGKEGGR